MFRSHKWVLFLALLLILPACKPRPPEVVVEPPAMPADAGGTWWNDRVFYEVFVRSFQDSSTGPLAGDGKGDLQGLIDRLDYLNDGDSQTTDDLGITGLWLMPIAESPSYHGYDVADYYSVEKDYGDKETFQRLIAEAHKRGIVVIVDLVINHTSSGHPWFVDAARDPQSPYRPWYIWSDEKLTYQGPWGQQVWYERGDAWYYAIFWEGMPDLNYRTPAVTEAMYDVTRFWLVEMGADGFRMDAIRHLIEDGRVQENTAETHQWLADYHQFYKSINPNALTVGEVWTRSEDVVPYVGDELDICFEFDLATAILEGARTGSTMTLPSIVKKVDKLYPPQQYATFLTNHDHNRAMSQLNGDVGKAKLAAAIYLTLPGVPFIYYGEEIGLTGVKPDENLRTPMQWNGDANAGFSTSFPWYPVNADYTTKNVAAQLTDPDSLLNYYKELIRLRLAFAALRTGQLGEVMSSARTVYAYDRHGESEDVLVVHNLGTEAVSEYALQMRAGPIPAGTYRVYDLLGEAWAADLTVGENGAFEGYVPIAELSPMTSTILLLQKK